MYVCIYIYIYIYWGQSRFRRARTWTGLRREQLLIRFLLKHRCSLRKHMCCLNKSHGAQHLETWLKRPLSLTKETCCLYKCTSFRYRHVQTASNVGYVMQMRGSGLNAGMRCSGLSARHWCAQRVHDISPDGLGNLLKEHRHGGRLLQRVTFNEAFRGYFVVPTILFVVVYRTSATNVKLVLVVGWFRRFRPLRACLASQRRRV